MATQQQQTSTGNPDYDLISTLYHSLESAQTYAIYIQDAQASGDQDLANFFQNMHQQCDQSAEQAKQILARRISVGGPGGVH